MKLLGVIFSLALLCRSFSVVATEPDPRIAELQAGLAELGYDPGPPDGVLGSKTRLAIMAYQKDQELNVDGEYSESLSTSIELDRKHSSLYKAIFAMSDNEFTKFLVRIGEQEAQRIHYHFPERFKDLSIYLILSQSNVLDVAISIALRQLLYPPSREGVEQFQSDIGAEPSGELTWRQWWELHRRALRQRDVPVYDVSFKRVWVDDEYGIARASGTWFGEGEAPINTVQITCDPENRECMRVVAEVHVPSLDDDDSLVFLSQYDEFYHLELRPVRRYRILSWSNHEIIALERRGCDVAMLNFNGNSKGVYEAVTNDEDVDANCRNPPSPFDRPRITRLASSSPTGREFWDKRRQATASYVNPRVREEIQQALEAVETPEHSRPALGPADGTR